MNFPTELYYTKDHEWASELEGNVITIGITEHAQEALGEIVYAELPQAGRELKANETFGVVESIKAVSDLYCPVAGQVTEVNPAVSKDPSLINRHPYGEGWLIKLKVSDVSSLKTLMPAHDYAVYVKGL